MEYAIVRVTRAFNECLCSYWVRSAPPTPEGKYENFVKMLVRGYCSAKKNCSGQRERGEGEGEKERDSIHRIVVTLTSTDLNIMQFPLGLWNRPI